MVSINAVWEESLAFVRREAGLVIPLALATLFVGDVVTTLATPTASGTDRNPLLSLLMLAALGWTLIGQLAIIALVLRPGSSVGEAIGLARRRLPTLVGAALIVGVAVALVMTPAIIGFVAAGIDPRVPDTFRKLPGWVSLYILVGAGVLFWLSVRMMPLSPLIVDTRPGIITALRKAFALTRGVAARLVLVALLYLVTLVVMSQAVRFVFGTLFALVGNGAGSPLLGEVLTALATGLVGTAFSALSAIFIAVLYRRLSTGT